jgi:DNA polymerase-1
VATDKKLFLLDAMALIYRAYFAFSNNHRINSKGQNTSAIFGFTNTLLDVFKKERPTHIAVVFDTHAPTARHEEFAEYKANRQEIPEDLASSIPWVIKICEGFNIPVIFLDGFEADDIIGTLAKQAEQEGFDTYMMTPDKDFGQLVDQHTFIYKPARAGGSAEVMGIKEVCARWEIERVDQVKDILGLMGDSVDNIPGIPGVGEKTAIQLVKQFGSIEELIKNTDQLKGKLKEKVELNKDLAVQSKRLATILLDVPIKIKPGDLKVMDPDKKLLGDIFSELEFRRLADQLNITSQPQEKEKLVTTQKVVNVMQATLFGQEETEVVQEVFEGEIQTEIPRPVFKTIKDVDHNYEVVDTEEKIKKLVDLLGKQKIFCFDTETTSIDANNAELVGLSFSIKPNEAYYVPVPANQSSAKKIVSAFKPVLENPSIEKIAQNMKYDLTILRWYDVYMLQENLSTR